MSQRVSKDCLIALVGVLSLFAVGCQMSNSSSGSNTGTINASPASVPGGTSVALQKAAYDVNIFPINQLVCDPFEGPYTPEPGGGLQAALYYYSAEPASSGSVESFIANATKSDQNLFFAQVDVPTRNFSTGFSKQDGTFLTDDNGNVLIEWFALRFNSVLQLGLDQPEGLYQFAILSDDGSILQMDNSDGTQSVLINNDGTHPTRMGCSTQKLNLTHESQIPIQLDYYQGPRYQIAAVVMMRLAQPNDPQDLLCGQEGNYLYFNPDQNSAPEPAYTDLLARGWTVVGPANYVIPSSAGFNPCTVGQPPVISNLQLTALSYSSFQATWTTDIPATSQLDYTNTMNLTETLTTADNYLRTQHSVIVTGLANNTLYSVEAVSISDNYGKTISPPQEVRTLNIAE